MSSNNSRPASALSSRPSSRMSLTGLDSLEYRRPHHATSNYTTNIGLARLLDERNIFAGSTISLDKWSAPQSDVVSICSLTPSVISSPKGDRAFSPTGTPLNSPVQTPPGTPPNEKVTVGPAAAPGFVSGFFSSLRAALYGEQQKEVQAQILRQKRKKRKPVMKRLGILEKVEEVGIERFMSASPAPSSLDEERNEKFWASLSSEKSGKYKPDLLSDELEEIEPGTLTVSRSDGTTNNEKLLEKTIKPKKPSNKDSPVAGQLKAPTFTVLAPTSLSLNEVGKLPSDYQAGVHPGVVGSAVGGRGPGRVISPSEKRIGVPGQPGTGALRTDLGFVPVTSASANRFYRAQSESDQTSFIGSIAQMFFGRKGGLF
jgi:hypothetical protein